MSGDRSIDIVTSICIITDAVTYKNSRNSALGAFLPRSGSTTKLRVALSSSKGAPWVNDHFKIVYTEGVTQFPVVVAMICETPLRFPIPPSPRGRGQGEGALPTQGTTFAELRSKPGL